MIKKYSYTKNLIPYLFLILFIVLPGCKDEKLTPLKFSLKLEKSRSNVEFMENVSGVWKEFESESSKININSVKTGNGGAVFELFDSERSLGKIWLKEDTEIVLMEDGDKTIHFYLMKGNARISMFDGSDKIILDDRKAGKTYDISGNDTLFHRLTVDSEIEILETSENVEWANWCVDLELEQDPVGLGVLTTKSRSGDRINLQLRKLNVDAVQHGDVVLNNVEHIFYNDSDERLEGTFRFYLPEGATVTGLAMEVNGKLMEGELVEKEKAKKIYQKIVDSMRDPAILEWQQGQMFKLRVFPIEPKSEKRVVLRFLSPLKKNFNDYEYQYNTEAPPMQKKIDEFKLSFNGKKVVEQSSFDPGESIVVKIPKKDYPGKVRKEVKDDGIYTCVRIRPDYHRVSRNSEFSKSQDLLILFDTSRSSLESYKLAIQSVETILKRLRPKDRFRILASDIYKYENSDQFLNVNEKEIKKALTFLYGITPDGASDFGLSFKEAAKIIKDKDNVQIVYIGNGIPTWGETDNSKLRKFASENFKGVPFNGILLGKGASSELIGDIAGLTGGTFVSPGNLREINRFAFQISLPQTRRISNVKVEGADYNDIFPKNAKTLFEGDEMVCLFFTPKDKSYPSSITLKGSDNGKDFIQDIDLKDSKEGKYIAYRWALRKMAHMTSENKEKEEIVKLSLKHGVMSKYTAFLVLESEEEYKKYGIERKKAQQNNDPMISGRNLESTSREQASLSPENVQSGDPTITIPAPPNAKSVTVILPFGETKKAVFDSEKGKWVTRFLVPPGTRDGNYKVFIRIDYKDGSFELFEMPYNVDSKSADFKISFTPHKEGEWKFSVVQNRKSYNVYLRKRLQKFKAILMPDLARVDLKLPDGTVLNMEKNHENGEFTAFWNPGEFLKKGYIKVRVVTFDRALNTSVKEIKIKVRK